MRDDVLSPFEPICFIGTTVERDGSTFVKNVGELVMKVKASSNLLFPSIDP